MKRMISLTLALFLFLSLAFAEGGTSQQTTVLSWHYADRQEGIDLILGNTDFYDSFSQNDIDYRLQKLNGTLDEMLDYAAAQVLEFSDEEKQGLDQVIQQLIDICIENGYTLPVPDEITLIKTTMHEEGDAGAYTHGTQIYLGDSITARLSSDNERAKASLLTLLAHELFHCLTRSNEEFRTAMYSILHFTTQKDDFAIGEGIHAMMITNPDVEHHNSYATFEINGEEKQCVVVFVTTKSFEQPGDMFFAFGATGLVPIDDLDQLYFSGDAANFDEVFGLNTGYVIDPEETLADNFAYALVYGENGREYPNPEIITAILDYLRK